MKLYYKKSIKNDANIATLLTSLLKNAFLWSDKVERVLSALKIAMFTTLILEMLDFTTILFS